MKFTFLKETSGCWIQGANIEIGRPLIRATMKVIQARDNGGLEQQ